MPSWTAHDYCIDMLSSVCLVIGAAKTVTIDKEMQSMGILSGGDVLRDASVHQGFCRTIGSRY